MNTNRRSIFFPGRCRATFLALCMLLLAPPLSAHEDAPDTPDTPDIRFDGLVPVPDAKMAMAYYDPDADFSFFTKVLILDPAVAFRSNWQRDQNRNRARNISSSDMDRIKRDVAALFKQVFAERLAANDGYEIVEEAGDDVLIIRPAIIDLDVTAPDTRSTGRTRNFTASAGAATMYMELFDSVSGDIIGRAADRSVIRSTGGRVSWTNSVTNTAEARRMFGRWADQLRAFLDAHYQ